ncbi:MAG: S41 family peptidase [Actinomycetota bacterium]
MSRLLRLVAGVVLVAAAFLGGVLVGGHPQATGLTDLGPGWRGFLLGTSGESLPDQVLRTLRSSYYKDVDVRALERTSVDEMIRRLNDPYTYYLTPEDLVAFRASLDGSYYGVGLQVAQRGAAVVITGVFHGSPAQEAGIKAGDRIVSVDGESATGKGLDVVVAMIKGPKDTTVRLGVSRPGRGTTVYPLTREKITVPVVASRMIARRGVKVAYVRLAQFTRGSSGALRRDVRRLAGRGARAFVLDLRGDPGGLVDEAVGVSGVFLRKGTPVVRTQGRHRKAVTLRTDDAPVATTAPLVILVDQNSASASEIVSGALRDARRATLVGRRTFGKALVQTTLPLRDGGALKLTTASYVTPGGTNLAHRGLMPDVAVSDLPATPADEALERALAVAAAKAHP